MKKIYESSSVEKCLKNACRDLNLNREQISYEVLKEKKGFFKNKVTISVELIKDEITKIQKDKDKIDKDKATKVLNEKDGSIKIVDGRIIVKSPKEDGKPASIVTTQNVNLKINGEEADRKVEVYEDSNVEIEFVKNQASRELNIHLSKDKMKAFASVKYVPEKIYDLKDKKENRIVVLDTEVVEEKFPPKYTVEEIKEELAQKNIVYGIIDKNIQKCVQDNCEDILVAEGKKMKNGEDDTIEIKFIMDKDVKNLKEDKSGKIDFKSIGAIEPVYKGDALGVKHVGEKGYDGVDITGKVKKHKLGKALNLKIGEGAKFKDQNIVVAAIDGKPCVKNNVFYVYKIHEIRGDVELKTGNIKFIGDIIVYGNVREGMKIEAGNGVDIHKNVERSFIKGKGDINVSGNIIASTISGGGEDIQKLKFIDYLTEMEEELQRLIQGVKEIKNLNLLGKDKKDGEIIKILIENKFKNISKLSLSIITGIGRVGIDGRKDKLVQLIRNKLIGIGPINIKHFNELEDIIVLIEEKIALLKAELSLPVNVKINYCQDCKIFSSGDVIVSGKGEYVSNIVANNGVYFVEGKCTARGGNIKAKKEIKCKEVGSTAGVTTKLIVEEKGHIWVDVAYQNTLFIVGNREFVLEVPSKDIHAYLDDKGDIIVDRLKL